SDHDTDSDADDHADKSARRLLLRWVFVPGMSGVGGTWHLLRMGRSVSDRDTDSDGDVCGATAVPALSAPDLRAVRMPALLRVRRTDAGADVQPRSGVPTSKSVGVRCQMSCRRLYCVPMRGRLHANSDANSVTPNGNAYSVL